ncbi:hypothetical protein ACA910_016889 [Epithemia clementina (nom. ined.)]
MPQTVGIAWLVSSALYTTYATNQFLNYKPTTVTVTERRSSVSPLLPPLTFPAYKWKVTRPTLLTLCRFGGSLLLGLIAHTDFRIWERIVETAQAAPAFLFPAACLFVANFSNAVSLDRIGISLTYTSKCAIPLITVLLALLMDGVKSLPNQYALLSLVPIAVGIGAASWNSPTFEIAGFSAAMLSATAQSALNVSSKRAMMKTGIRGASTQRVLVAVGLIIAMAVTYFENKSNVAKSTKAGSAESTTKEGEPLMIYVMAITAYHIEYVLSFMFVKLVSPVTFGACDAVRRLSVILAGRAMFGGKPLTAVNIAGIGLALLGALGYSVTTSIKK